MKVSPYEARRTPIDVILADLEYIGIESALRSEKAKRQ